MLNTEMLFNPQEPISAKGSQPFETELRAERVQILVALITKLLEKLSGI